MAAAQTTTVTVQAILDAVDQHREVLADLLSVRSVSAIQPQQVQTWQRAINHVLDAAARVSPAAQPAGEDDVVGMPVSVDPLLDDGLVETSPISMPVSPAAPTPVGTRRRVARDLSAPLATDPAQRP